MILTTLCTQPLQNLVRTIFQDAHFVAQMQTLHRYVLDLHARARAAIECVLGVRCYPGTPLALLPS